ncbi:MAG TPA: hypothetical protein PK295_04885 [Candidatus Magasanikbacteria bacterium]|nr:hypothetical protein [Candidatus Magasanikbacteria bacterium]
MIDIIPSILVQSEKEFLAQLASLEHAVPHVQLDIADGAFVSNTTWAEPEIVRHVERYTCELHLMVRYPLEVIVEWITVPQVTKFIVHVESTDNIEETISHIQASDELKRDVFVALNPETELTMLEKIVNSINGVLFMGVTPGFQGQKLIPAVLEKIAQCRKKYPHLYTELDGGVHEETLKDIVHSGVHAICPGSLVFKRQHSAAEQITLIKNNISNLK